MGHTTYTIHCCMDSQTLNSTYLEPDKVVPEQSVYKLIWAKTSSTRLINLPNKSGLPVRTERSVVGRHNAGGINACTLKLVFCHSLNVTAGRPTNESLELKTFCLFSSIILLVSITYITFLL
jgi:hypothetical protein